MALRRPPGEPPTSPAHQPTVILQKRVESQPQGLAHTETARAVGMRNVRACRSWGACRKLNGTRSSTCQRPLLQVLGSTPRERRVLDRCNLMVGPGRRKMHAQATAAAFRRHDYAGKPTACPHRLSRRHKESMSLSKLQCFEAALQGAMHMQHCKRRVCLDASPQIKAHSHGWDFFVMSGFPRTSSTYQVSHTHARIIPNVGKSSCHIPRPRPSEGIPRG